MKTAQDQIFDELYWVPAASQATAMQLELPLSWLLVYDSTIQSGVHGVSKIRKRFPELPPSSGGDEKAWVIAYLRSRRDWLLSIHHAASSVYRMDSMLQLAEQENWQLETPLTLLKPRITVT